MKLEEWLWRSYSVARFEARAHFEAEDSELGEGGVAGHEGCLARVQVLRGVGGVEGVLAGEMRGYGPGCTYAPPDLIRGEPRPAGPWRGDPHPALAQRVPCVSCVRVCGVALLGGTTHHHL